MAGAQIRPSAAVRARRSEVAQAIRRHGGVTAAVTGSVARGQDTADSDLDLLVEFEAGRDIVDLLSLEADLEAILTVPVDVISAASTGVVARETRQLAVPL